MKHTRNKPQTVLKGPQQQQGIVLIAALLVVVIITIIASAMTRTSGYEEKMATNAQTYNRTFQAAESAVEEVINNETLMFEAIDANDDLSSTLQVPLGTSGVTASAQTEFIGEGLVPGNSIGSVSSFRYEVLATGEMTNYDASTLIRQGFYRVSFVSSTNQ